MPFRIRLVVKTPSGGMLSNVHMSARCRYAVNEAVYDVNTYTTIRVTPIYQSICEIIGDL